MADEETRRDEARCDGLNQGWAFHGTVSDTKEGIHQQNATATHHDAIVFVFDNNAVRGSDCGRSGMREEEESGSWKWDRRWLFGQPQYTEDHLH